MECNVIRDLLPLYADSCCSKESGELVEEHIRSCAGCRKALTQMQTEISVTETACVPVKQNKVSVWKGAMLQSVMLFLSFALVTLGVTLENRIKSGAYNGYWATILIVPATAMLLGLANWYFIKPYKNRAWFTVCSGVLFAAVLGCGYFWVSIHYYTVVYPVGLAIAAACGIASVSMSYVFARLVGKE